MIVPFHFCMRMSSPSASPYEQVPSPMPFSPFSNSSSRRNERGTGTPEARTADGVSACRGRERGVFVGYLWPSESSGCERLLTSGAARRGESLAQPHSLVHSSTRPQHHASLLSLMTPTLIPPLHTRRHTRVQPASSPSLSQLLESPRPHGKATWTLDRLALMMETQALLLPIDLYEILLVITRVFESATQPLADAAGTSVCFSLA